MRRSDSQLSSPLVLWCLFGVPRPTFVPISKSKHPIHLALSTVCHLWSLPITLQCETTHSSINHLSVHTSCKSIHHRSIPSCYHQPLPSFPSSSPPALSPFIHPNLNPPIPVSIHTETFIYPLWIYLSNHLFCPPSFLPWLLIPVVRLSTARLNTLHHLRCPCTWAHTHTHTHADTKALPTGCRRKDTQTSFSQLPEQLKWPGRVCAVQRRRE